jgi:cysteine desulfurase/selenocysteine lyase
MSTPERPGIDGLALPGEAQLAQRQVPRPTHALELPTNHVPTPGLSPAVLKHPASPTLPDIDPVSTTLLIQRLANELYQAPIGAPSAASVPATPSVPGAPPSPGLATPSAPVHAAPSAHESSTPSPGSSAPSVPTHAGYAGPVASHGHSAPSVPGHASAAAPSRGGGGFPLTPTLSPFGREGGAPFEAPLNFSGFSPAGLDTAFSFPLLSSVPTAPASGAPGFTPSWPGAQLEPTSHGIRHLGPGVFDAHALKREFPILDQRVNGKPLVWLDNAATTQKPQAVIDRLSRFYSHENSNIHRAAHTLAARATDAYEGARESVRRFINAPSVKDLIFVRGTTEGINLIAQAYGRRNINAGDEILITHLEHHANIVPWQQLAAEKGAKLKVAPVDDTGQVIVEAFERLLGPRTKIVSFTQVSNALGTITPARQLVELAHRHGAVVVVDGAQSVSHLHTDVQALDCDFFVFSGHKVFAPTGIGVVYGKTEILDAMPPWQGGGNMISDVTFEKTTFHPAPARFEAGTGNIADAVGLGAALDWLSRIGLETVARYEHELLEYGTERLHEVPGLTMYGTAADKAGVLSFVLDGQKTEQVGALLDKEGIAVRSGHHCAQPILRRFGVEATVRASLAPYNTREDLDALVDALTRIQEGRR